MLAGIGTLPDTIADRSIPIRLQRKKREEKVERFRLREVRTITEPIRAKLEEWAAANGEALAAARPELPEELSDRMQEGCEPLLAIADALDYGVEAREALVKLLTADRVDSTERAQVRLLRDIRAIFDASPDAHAFLTRQLLSHLALTGGGWENWYGRALDDRGLAALLRPYGIESRTARSGDERGKGYYRDDFYDAWSRYLTETPETQEAVLA